MKHKILYIKKNLRLSPFSTSKGFVIHQHWPEKRGVSKMSRTCGHPVVSAENPIQGGGGGVRQTFVNFYLGNPLCAGSGTAILESTKVCCRPPLPPCTQCARCDNALHGPRALSWSSSSSGSRARMSFGKKGRFSL